MSNSSTSYRSARFLSLLQPIVGELECYARRMVWRREDVPDALQNAVLRAFSAFDRYREDTSFRAWIYRILTNEISTIDRPHTRTERPAEPAEAAQPEVVGLMFHSDTCGSCKVLNPKLDSVKSGYLAKPILFVTLDHTSDGTKNQAALMAGALGVKEAYAAEEKASGFLLLVDKESGEVLGKVTRDMTEAEIATTIDKAIAKG